ncbi:TPA: PilN family type IVB pilus formation outer membrane protein [Citrobacter freundii]|nr:PilN family type IVB pilus formation outer membrane protein [Citrobacter freundii]
MKYNLLAKCIALSFVLSGCSISRINDTMDKAESNNQIATKAMTDFTVNRPSVVYKDEQWINPQPLKFNPEDVPPPELTCKVAYKPVRPVDIYQFAQDVTTLCHVPVRITPDVAMLLSGQGGGNGSTQQLSAVPPPVLDSNNMVSLQSLNSPSSTATSGRSMGTRFITDFVYEGNGKGLMDAGASRFGVSWKYENNAITIFYLETKRFQIDATDAKTKLYSLVKSGISTQSGTSNSSSGSSGSGGVSGDSGSNSNTEVQLENDLYGDIKTTAQSMLTPGVGRLSMNNTSGAIVVTDVPDVVRNIGNYLNSENSSLSKQVKLSVKIYTINLNRNDELGVNWSLVWNSLSGKYGISLANSFPSSTDAISGGFQVLDTATGSAKQFAGSDVLFKALSEQVKVSDVKTNNIMTTNLAAVPVQVASQVTYLQSVTSEQTSNVGTSGSLNPGSVTTGTNITILPKIAPDSSKIMLTMFMDISNLKQIRQINNADKTNLIEAPDVDSNSINQRVWLKPNQTIVMSGFEQEVSDATKQGVGDPNNIIFGGGMNGKNSKRMFVISITPVIS